MIRVFLNSSILTLSAFTCSCSAFADSKSRIWASTFSSAVARKCVTSEELFATPTFSVGVSVTLTPKAFTSSTLAFNSVSFTVCVVLVSYSLWTTVSLGGVCAALGGVLEFGCSSALTIPFKNKLPKAVVRIMPLNKPNLVLRR